MTAREKIIAKVRSLLGLATSSNPHEAANAAAKAQALLQRHKIEMAALEDVADESEPVMSGIDAPLERGTIPTWRGSLAGALAQANDARAFFNGRRGGKRLYLVGRSSDVNAVRYLYQALSNEVERLAKIAIADPFRDMSLNGRTFGNSFRQGAVSMIGERLEASSREVREQAKADGLSTALVRVDQQAGEVDAWVEENLGKIRSKRASKTDMAWDAFSAGRRAGRVLDLEAKGGALGHGAAGEVSA